MLSYVSTNVETYGVLTNFANAQSASDSGAYATLREEQGSGGTAESGSVQLLINQPNPNKDVESWYEWLIVNPTDSDKTCTEVRVKRTDSTDIVWTIGVQGNPTSGWADGGTNGLYWSGSETISAHSSLLFRARADTGIDQTDAGLTWSATVTGETVTDVTTSVSVKGGPGGSCQGGIYYNKPDDTTEQTEATTYLDGLYTYLTEDGSSQSISAGTEYTFYMNIHEWKGKAIDAGGTLNITIPQEFTGVQLNDATDFSDAAVSGGSSSDWWIEGTNDADVNNDVQHLSFDATTPSGYTTNSCWEFDTRFTGTGNGLTVRMICEAVLLVQADSSNAYKMDIEFNTTNVQSAVNYYLQLNYSTCGTETDFGVQVYNSVSSDWDDLGSQGDLTSTTFTTKEYTLDSDHRLGSGYVRARFIGRNETTDDTNSTLNIEYLRIKSTPSYLTLTGESSGDMFGWSVSNTSDVNDDGTYDDVIVGAPGYSSDTGRAYIYHGASSMDSTSDLTLTGETAGDRFGYSVSGAGDMDDDGAPDVIVGAPFYDDGTDTDAGIIYIYKGGSSMDNTADWADKGENADDHFGWSVSFAGDVNNDGYQDVVVGAPGYDDTTPDPDNTDAGKSYVLSTIPEFTMMAVPLSIVLVVLIIRRKKKRPDKF